jgi:hypothetical protein
MATLGVNRPLGKLSLLRPGLARAGHRRENSVSCDLTI